MFARISALLVWALVAMTVVFWGLRLGSRSQGVPPNAIAVADPALHGDLTRLLGAPPVVQPVAAVAPELASRFKLLGVMAPKRVAAGSAQRPGRFGVALIAVDGSPAKAFAVGSRVEDDLVLQSVSLRGASIGPAQGDSALQLELPPLQPAATGTLPPPMTGAAMPAGGFGPALRRARGGSSPAPAPTPMPAQTGQPFEQPQEPINGATTE